MAKVGDTIIVTGPYKCLRNPEINQYVVRYYNSEIYISAEYLEKII